MEKIVYLVIWITFLLSCNNPNKLIGEWEFIGGNSCDINFLGMNSFSYPGNMYGHKISFTKNNFYNPSKVNSRKKYLPEVLDYKASFGNLNISGYESISYSLRNDSLIMVLSGCNLFFKKVKKHKTLKNLNIKKIIFTVTDIADEKLVDSLSVSKSEIVIYKENVGKGVIPIDTSKYIDALFRIINNVDVRYLNKSFDNPPTDDKNRDTFYFVDEKNKTYQIVSYGQFKTPYDVILLRKYLYKLYW